MPQNLLDLTSYELATEIEAGRVSAREAAEVANARVEEVDGEVNAFLTTTPASVLLGSTCSTRGSSCTRSP